MLDLTNYLGFKESDKSGLDNNSIVKQSLQNFPTKEQDEFKSQFKFMHKSAMIDSIKRDDSSL